MFRTRFAPFSLLLVLLVALAAPLAALAQDDPVTGEFISTTGNLTLYYPPGWDISDEDSIIALTNEPGALSADQIPKDAIGILVIEPRALRDLLIGFDAPTLPDVGAALAVLLSQSEENFEPGSMVELTIADRPAVRVTASTETNDIVFYVVDHGGGALVAVMAITQPGGQAAFAEILLAITASIEYAPSWAGIFVGHTDSVRAVAFSPDGSRIASGADDTSVRLWDTATGEEVLALNHWLYVYAVAFSPDGALIATGADTIVYVWDAATGEQITQLEGHTDYVRGVAVSPDGALIASASDDKTVRLWKLDGTWQAHTVLSGHTDWVNSVAFSADGSRLASGSDDRTVRVWDVASGAEVLALEHPDYVRSAVFSADGSRLVSGSDDGLVRVWDAATGASVAELAGHTDYVRSVAISPDGLWIASGSDDSTIRLWLFEDGWHERGVLTGHGGWVRAVAFSPDGLLVASGADDDTVIVWDVPR